MLYFALAPEAVHNFKNHILQASLGLGSPYKTKAILKNKKTSFLQAKYDFPKLLHLAPAPSGGIGKPKDLNGLFA